MHQKRGFLLAIALITQFKPWYKILDIRTHGSTIQSSGFIFVNEFHFQWSIIVLHNFKRKQFTVNPKTYIAILCLLKQNIVAHIVSMKILFVFLSPYMNKYWIRTICQKCDVTSGRPLFSNPIITRLVEYFGRRYLYLTLSFVLKKNVSINIII